MRARFVTELAEGSRVDAAFVVRSKEIKAARNGDAYLSLTLGDKTGSIHAVFFRPDRSAASAPVGSVVHVQGTVTTFHGSRRVSIETMAPAVAYAREDFLPSGTRPAEELVAEFGALVRSVEEPSLRSLLLAVFSDKEFFTKFSTWPAAANGGRSHLGGLIEHSIEVARLCSQIAARHPVIDRDLAVAAALLHDVGTVDELECDVAITVTDVGRLLGHIALGVRRLHAAAQGLKVDDMLLARLEHAVLSHHGDHGQSLAPSTPEAIAVCRADGLETEAVALEEALGGAVLAQEQWTGPRNRFGRALYALGGIQSDRHLAAAG